MIILKIPAQKIYVRKHWMKQITSQGIRFLLRNELSCFQTLWMLVTNKHLENVSGKVFKI